MINKSLVKKRFKKSLKTYDENAIVQKQMATELLDLIPCKKYTSIFEVGCATGVLTKEIKTKLFFDYFVLNDLVSESKKYIDEIIPNNVFISGDIEEINVQEKFDLIVSNACLQWCCNLEKTIEKMMKSLNENGFFAFSLFGEGNLKEIKSAFDIEHQNYYDFRLKTFLEKYNIVHIEEKEIQLKFDCPIDVLKHLKATGVNAIKEYKLTKTSLKLFEHKYLKDYSKEGKVTLTYNPVYIVLQNK